jgi:hypothetical protein
LDHFVRPLHVAYVLPSLHGCTQRFIVSRYLHRIGNLQNDWVLRV